MYETIILNVPNVTDWAQERNQLLKRAKPGWVFFLDPDEQVTPQLAAEMESPNQHYAGYYLRRDDYFMGRWLKFGETGTVRLLRFAKRNVGQWVGKVHETWQVTGPTGEFKNHLKHYSHKNITSFITKINRYTDIAADKQFSYLKLLYPVGKFMQNYFFRLGFLDGFPGFVMAYMMSLHSLIVRVKEYDLSRVI